jgi:hypothetical protein
VFHNEEAGAICSTNHEWVEACVWDTASVLTTDVNKERSITCPVVVVYPEALLVGAIVLGIEVVHQVVKGLLDEGIHVDLRKVASNKATVRGGSFKEL